MPYDIDASHIENIILELQEKIDVLTWLPRRFNLNLNAQEDRILNSVIGDLKQEKERQYMRLKVHRYETKNSGIKY